MARTPAKDTAQLVNCRKIDALTAFVDPRTREYIQAVHEATTRAIEQDRDLLGLVGVEHAVHADHVVPAHRGRLRRAREGRSDSSASRRSSQKRR